MTLLHVDTNRQALSGEPKGQRTAEPGRRWQLKVRQTWKKFRTALLQALSTWVA